MTFPCPSSGVCLRTTEAMLAIGSLLLSAELWFSRSDLRDAGLLSWPLLQPMLPAAARRLLAVALDPLFRYPAVLTSVVFRFMAAAVLLLFVFSHRPTALPLLCLVLLTALFHLRQPFARDGARQFLLMGLIACAAAECFATPVACRLTLLFLAAQASLAYATSGGLKLFHRDWWNGSSILYVLSAHDCGVPTLYRLFTRQRSLASIAGVLLVLGECLLSLAPLLPLPICALLLAGGVLLHLTLARIFGLNIFVWAFPASYPAAYFISLWLYRGAL